MRRGETHAQKKKAKTAHARGQGQEPSGRKIGQKKKVNRKMMDSAVLDAPVELEERPRALPEHRALPAQQRGLDGEVVDPALEPRGRGDKPQLLQNEEEECELAQFLHQVGALRGVVEAEADDEVCDEVLLRGGGGGRGGWGWVPGQAASGGGAGGGGRGGAGRAGVCGGSSRKGWRGAAPPRRRQGGRGRAVRLRGRTNMDRRAHGSQQGVGWQR